MPGENCSVGNCGTSGRQKNVAIFKLSGQTIQNGERMLNFIIRDWHIYADFKRQLDKKKNQSYQIYFCESQYGRYKFNFIPI